MRALILLLLAGVAAAGEPTRADLARGFLRFEGALAAHPPADRAAISRRFDEVTMEFFRGGLTGVLAGMDELTAGLEPDGLLAPGLFVRAAPELAGPGVPARVRVEAWRDDPRAWLLRARDSNGAVTFERAARAGEEWEVPPGSRLLSLELGDGTRFPAARLTRLERDPEEWRAELLARCDAVEGLEEACTSFRARVGLLGSERTAALLIEPEVLLAELEGEIAALESGQDPYAGRTGDFWRVVRSGGFEIPVRFVAPDSAFRKERLPLVIALHGAGGDENLWCFGYGAGRLADLARTRRFVLLTPSTYAVMTSDRHLDALIAEAERCYPIDRQRVVLLGHSLGAMTAYRLAVEHGDALARVACIAGALGGTPRIPVRVWGGGFDPIVPAARLRGVLAVAREAGAPVEFVLEPEEGHTLLVPAVLDDAVAWLLGRERAE